MGFAGFTGISEYIDKQRGLSMFDRLRAAENRNADISADIDKQAPKRRMGDAIEAL